MAILGFAHPAIVVQELDGVISNGNYEAAD